MKTIERLERLQLATEVSTIKSLGYPARVLLTYLMGKADEDGMVIGISLYQTKKDLGMDSQGVRARALKLLEEDGLVSVTKNERNFITSWFINFESIETMVGVNNE